MKKNFLNGLSHIGMYGLGLCLSTLACSCSDNDNQIANVTPPTVVGVIANGGFEHDLDSWNVTGEETALTINDGGCEGAHYLSIWAEQPYNVSLDQTVEKLEDGLYDLEFYYRNGGGQPACYVQAGGNAKITSLDKSASTWTRAYVRGIKVENGKCPISINVDSQAGGWAQIDNLCLVKSDKEFSLIKGGDISELSYLEQNGGKFYQDGQETDCVELLKNNGMNLVRLRLYNDPGNPDFTPSNRLPKGIEDEEDILSLAKRAKAAGMQILLTFHYSDYWTNGGAQAKPHEWEGLKFDELKKALGDYTARIMKRMADQGTTPEYVSLGNETQAGMLYPDGACANMANLSALYNAGYDAVKSVSKDTKVIIHSSGAGDKDNYNWLFGELKKYGTRYDIIGASYYPFWTAITAKQLADWAEYTSNKFDKDILLMETGYAWRTTLPDGTPGQLSHNGPYTDFSHLGQKNFMLELTKEIKNVKNGRLLGYIYWDPIFIEVPGTGWELGAKNCVSNSTLFDFDGNAQEVFDALKYNN